MRKKKVYQYVLGVTLLLGLSLGCSLVDRVAGLRSTAESVGTAVGDGLELIDTVGAAATSVEESGIKDTALAAATKIDESGLKDTALAVGTKIEESGVKETVQAAATEVFISPEGVPEDIPIYDAELNAFVGSERAVSYFVDVAFADVLDFYKMELPARGWSKVDFGTVETDMTAELHYEKGNRELTVVITEVPFVNQTTVVISIVE
jgi:hypothetical protein